MTIEMASRISVDELGLSARVTRCSHDKNLDTLYQVAQLSEFDWLRYRNIGKKSLMEIKSKFSELGLHMGMRDSEWERDSSGTDGDAAEEERRVGKLVLELFSILNARSTNRKDWQAMEGKSIFEGSVISREDAAKIMGVSAKRVDDFARSGHLKRVYFPGNQRSSGLTRDSVMSLVMNGAR